MSKTISIRVKDEFYGVLKEYANAENRSLSNFLETVARKYIKDAEYLSDQKMSEEDQSRLIDNQYEVK